MKFTFFFYDLETTGVDSRRSRIMQFAGQRTDENLKPIGEPYNIIVKLTDDVLPDPDAILLTGITPQKTLEEGITEAEFCKIFEKEISTPGTCFVGYNSIRFDDEFMRFLLYRNFRDPYAWQWKDGRSRWDLLDVIRMTRALRPGDVNWPVDDKGVATNRLELLTAQNNLLHEAAHDALSDVKATIAIADMIKAKQPKLFSYLLTIRGKKEVMQLLAAGEPFVYSSGRYASEFEKTTVAYNLGAHPAKQGALVYDLRHDPTQFLKMDAKQLAETWKYTTDKEAVRLPVKALQFNRSPAVAPLAVLNPESADRLKIDLKLIKKHREILDADDTFYSKLREAVDIMNNAREAKYAVLSDLQLPEEKLYESFIGDGDRKVSDQIVNTEPAKMSEAASKLKDDRLKSIFPLYKARNFPQYLNDEEREAWETHRHEALLGGGPESSLAKFSKRLAELSQTTTDSDKQYLIEELRLYAESIVPEDF